MPPALPYLEHPGDRAELVKNMQDQVLRYIAWKLVSEPHSKQHSHAPGLS